MAAANLKGILRVQMRGGLSPVRLCQGSNDPGLPDHVGMALNPARIQYIAPSMQYAHAISDTMIMMVYDITGLRSLAAPNMHIT